MVPNSSIAVVVAHPDDEVLWMSSVLARAERTVFCFGDLFGNPKRSEARRRALAELPLSGLFNLEIPQSGVFPFVDWTDLQPASSGFAITDANASARYNANYPRLVNALRSALAGVHHVATHNPWGEYGHPEHIQVYRAIAALQPEFGYTIWFSNYVGARSWPLARQLGRRLFWEERRKLVTDKHLARQMMGVYLRNGAWTADHRHRWPDWETFYKQSLDLNGRYPLIGEWLHDVAACRWPPLRPQLIIWWLREIARLQWWPFSHYFGCRRLA